MTIPFAHNTALRFQVSPSKTVHVLVEVHHLKAIELVGHRLDLFLLSGLNDFDAWCIPSDVGPWCGPVLTVFKANGQLLPALSTHRDCYPPALTVPLGTFPL